MKATQIEHSKDDYSALVSFWGEVEEQPSYVILSLSVNPTSQDIALGHDTIHVEINGQLNSGYGTLNHVKYSASDLQFCLSAKHLNLDSDWSELTIDGSSAICEFDAALTVLREMDACQRQNT